MVDETQLKPPPVDGDYTRISLRITPFPPLSLFRWPCPLFALLPASLMMDGMTLPQQQPQKRMTNLIKGSKEESFIISELMVVGGYAGGFRRRCTVIASYW